MVVKLMKNSKQHIHPETVAGDKLVKALKGPL